LKIWCSIPATMPPIVTPTLPFRFLGFDPCSATLEA
jgi:hypothetical protein